MIDSSLNILIISDEGPQTGSAGGLLLHRLFDGYPAGRLRVLARHIPKPPEGLPGVAYQRLMIPWHRFESSRFHELKRSLRALGLTPGLAATKLDRAVGDFQPDIVLCVMQHAQYYDTAREFAARRNLPLVVIVHDVNDKFEPVYPWARRAANARDGAFYRQAALRLCISQEMEELCFSRFGVRGDVLYPNRSESLVPRPFDLARTLRTPERLTLGFAGALGYGYGGAIEQMLPALRATKTRLVVYGRPPEPDAELARATDVCEFRGFVPSADAWAGIQRDCDAVWLPYPNPAGEMELLYRYHFPSKLPEYLALGMPVIVSGPEYATGVRWARTRTQAAAAATGADCGEFQSLLQRMNEDSAYRRDLAEAGWRAGQEAFDPVAIKARFFARIQATCRRNHVAD